MCILRKYYITSSCSCSLYRLTSYCWNSPKVTSLWRSYTDPKPAEINIKESLFLALSFSLCFDRFPCLFVTWGQEKTSNMVFTKLNAHHLPHKRHNHFIRCLHVLAITRGAAAAGGKGGGALLIGGLGSLRVGWGVQRLVAIVMPLPPCFLYLIDRFVS